MEGMPIKTKKVTKQPASSHPLVAIIIVNWNGGKKIIECLTSLKRTSYPNYKVILIDNGSEGDSISELVKINPTMEVIRLPKNFGYTIATNIGWKHAIKKLGADYICAMDSDIITIQDNWLDLQIAELEKSPQRGISCGKLVFPDDRLNLLFFERKPGDWEEKDEGQYDFVKEVEGVGGACIIIKRSVIEKIGFYDENFFYGPNDADYCLRARKAGFIVMYNGLAKIIHNGSSSYLASDRTRIFGPQAEGNIIYTFRHFGNYRGSKMIGRQAVRIFVTRKNPYAKMTLQNTAFHRDIFKRFFIFLKASYSALKSYKIVKNGDYEQFIIKPNEKNK